MTASWFTLWPEEWQKTWFNWRWMTSFVTGSFLTIDWCFYLCTNSILLQFITFFVIGNECVEYCLRGHTFFKMEEWMAFNCVLFKEVLWSKAPLSHLWQEIVGYSVELQAMMSLFERSSQIWSLIESWKSKMFHDSDIFE